MIFKKRAISNVYIPHLHFAIATLKLVDISVKNDLFSNFHLK